MKILILNAGSSTQKSALYEIGESLPEKAPTPLWQAKVDWTKKENVAILQAKTARGKSLEEELPTSDRRKVTSQMLNTLWRGDTAVISQLSEIERVGHRVVHGGEEYREATIITPEVKEAIHSLSELAPEHNPVNLEGIEAIEEILPDVTQVAVFDTGFHSSIPQVARVYPLPYSYYQQGIQRYGFHGISYQYCLQRTAQIVGKEAKELKVIICHLGSGCSLAAIKHGVCVNTTMGYTPLEGLMMGSRSGSIDPGIVIEFLMKGYDANRINQLLNEESGLKGLSGGISDMRSVREAIESGNEQAKLTFDVFVHRLRFHIGAMLASLGGLDVLVFTAGIGENESHTREAACQDWEFLGLKIDAEKNNNSPQDADVSASDSAVRILVINTSEEWAIAQECWKLAQ